MTLRHPTAGYAGTPEELAAAKAAQLARKQEMDAVRQSAAKWQGGLAGLLALVTASVGLGLRDRLIAINPDRALWIGILLTVALICALSALFLALHASGGMPRLVKSKDVQPDSAHQNAVIAAKRLQGAVWLAICALTIFVISSWLYGTAPKREEPKPPPPKPAVVTSDQVTACGITEVEDNYVLIATPDGRVVPIELSAVESWQRVDRCP